MRRCSHEWLPHPTHHGSKTHWKACPSVGFPEPSSSEATTECITSLVRFPLENLGTIPEKRPTLHPQSPHKPGRALPTQSPSREFIYRRYQRKENLPHYISCFSPCPPCQSMSSAQFAIPAVVRSRFILTNFTKGCYKAGGGR